MHNVLIYAPPPMSAGLEAIREECLTAGYRAACPDLDCAFDVALDRLQGVFCGRPPDLVLADLSSSPDFLPMRHLERLLHALWGSAAPIAPRLALMRPGTLAQAEWLAATDDFLLPPFTPAEAIARIKLLLFRRRHMSPGDEVLFAGLSIDLAGGEVRDCDGRSLRLRPREFDLLRFLIAHRGRFFNRGQLLDMVWGVDFAGTERTVDIHVRRLRAKLPPEASRQLETLRGVGYGLRNTSTQRTGAR
ncbi:MAG TPA: response regulator transcription factor [Chthonomonadaceae bacterium]|nr:response regulator transcription factor [Chthonomonadaceae bacterium]